MTVNNKTSRKRAGIIPFMLTLLLVSACIGETDNCFTGVPLKINLPKNIGHEVLKDLTVYVFDDKKHFLEALPAPVDGSVPVMLNYQGIDTLYCVVLGNIQDDSKVQVSKLKKGDPMSSASVSLVEEYTRDISDISNTIYSPPSDIHYAMAKIDNTSTSYHIEQQEITLTRRVAQMDLSIRGLELISGGPEGNYSLVIGKTPNRMSFEGSYELTPSASFEFTFTIEAGKDYVIPRFNTFPNNNPLSVQLYKNGKHLRTVYNDGFNKPFMALTTGQAGYTKGVHIVNFELNTHIDVQTVEWGEKIVWQDYE